jgi:hypothetical protein
MYHKSVENRKKSNSMYVLGNGEDKISPYKVSQADEMHKTNLRIGERLNNIKS